MIISLTLAIATSLGTPPAGDARVPSFGLQPRVTVWTNRDEDPYHRGERVQVYFSTDRDAYVTIFRVDTDGRLRVLFPVEPWEDNFARGDRTFEVLGRAGTPAFRIDDPPGVGYIFAISSLDPFDYHEISLRDRWDYRAVSDGRVAGDPYVALTDLADRIAYRSDYDYDIIPYYVERHYDYPRFVCYDCHIHPMYTRWDPYGTSCTNFRLVIYDDPYYYPYRRYDGRRVVIVRPKRPGARYVFKDADGKSDYVTRARRPATTDRDRRAAEGDRSGKDVGGRGSVPAPVEPRTRRPTPAQPAPTTGAPDRRRTTEPDRARPMVPSTRPTPEAESGRRGVVVPRPDAVKRDRPDDDQRRQVKDQPTRRALPPTAAPAPAQSSKAVQRRPTDSGSRARTPDRSTTRRANPSTPTVRNEPRRAPAVSRPAPTRAKTPQAEPKRASPPKTTPRKSTGTPELKRRKP